MAVINNLVVVVNPNSVNVTPGSPGTVSLQINVFLETGESYSTDLSFPVTSTKNQRALNVIPKLQQTVQNLGHTLAAAPNVLVLGD